MNYFIKKRKTFNLVAYTSESRKKTYHPLDPLLKVEVDSINKQFLIKGISESDAVALLKEIIRKHTNQGQRSARLLSINRKIFDQFWKDVYGPRILEDPDTPRYGILKALRSIEPLSIQVASAAELQSALKRSLSTIPEIRRATDNLNQVLRYLKRDIRLNKPKRGMRKISYVTYEEFEKMLMHLEGHIKDLAIVLYTSGMRLGEALAVEPGDYRNGVVHVCKQLTRKDVTKLPKAEKTGHSLVLPIGHEAMLRWAAVGDKGRFRETIYGIVTRASRTSLGRSISPHDLRHSHAIHLLGQGANLSQVALQLRNRIDVCQEYYAGYSHSEQSLDTLKKVLDTSCK